MDSVTESLQTTIKDNYEVIVIGGGIAGVASAVASARCGAKTLLIEKTVSLGGLATIGLINIYLPLCNGSGRLLSTGIAEELLLLSIKNGYSTLDTNWARNNKRYMTEFNPWEYILGLEQWVIENNVDILYDTLYCANVMDGNHLKAVIFEDKDGRYAINCKVCIDTSGDCDVMYRLGAKCVEGENYLSTWAYLAKYNNGDEMKHLGLINNYRIAAGADHLDEEEILDGNFVYMKGLSGKNITDFMVASRKLLRRKVNPEDAAFISLPTMAPYRTTRRIEGVHPLLIEEENIYIDTSIGCCGDWRKKGMQYEISFGALYDAKIENVLCAGRCAAAIGDAWEISRVIPVCALTGQASGTAAALMAKYNVSCQDLDIKTLQQRLVEDGVLIHL